MSRVRAFLIPVLMSGTFTGCSGDDLVLPEPPTGAGFRVEAVHGDNQTGTVGQPLPEPLVVEVRNEAGLPVSEWRVAFVTGEVTSAGSVDPDTAETDDNGRATAQWLLGTRPGQYSVEARLVGPSQTPPIAHFEASALPDAPDTLRAVSPLSQPGRRGEQLPEPVVVAVVDRYGNAISGVPVRWEVTAGEGTVSQPLVATDTSGLASVLWTLGDRIGVQKLAASLDDAVNGSPMVFTAVTLF